ncbi:amidase family protein [Glaciihabitans sp. UYNi722]|uniref:amidase family protein n=1 Tax=Glaciihabitans sp. UYNi722 TaxID=3156344 RepID=UPI003397B8DC
MDTSFLQNSATSLLHQLTQQTLTAVELIESVHERIAERDGELGAMSAWDPVASLTAARRIDAARANGSAIGPLAGLPVSVKDSIDSIGLRTAHGRLSDSHVATRDAPVVRRLREAGGIIVGKTNAPVYLADYQAITEFATTRNPWDLGRTPGGSSSGAAAAVAAGISAVDFGSDLSGSLRVPAAWCGLFGHRPSNGIVSKIGQMPWPTSGLLEPLVSAVGPMTRSAKDARLFFDHMIGVEGPEAVGWNVELPPARVVGIHGIRIGLWLENDAADVDAETRAALQAFADRASDAGALISELKTPPGTGIEGERLFQHLHASEIVHGFEPALWEEHLRNAGMNAGKRGDFSRLVTQSYRAGIEALEAQALATQEWASEVFSTLDIVLCPAAPTSAPLLSDVPAEDRTIPFDDGVIAAEQTWRWSRQASLPKLPSTVIPLGAGAKSGLPIGAQLLAPYLEDYTSLQFAADAEEAGLVSYVPPPSWW